MWFGRLVAITLFILFVSWLASCAPWTHDDKENGVRCYLYGYGISCVKVKVV
jgi:hypothetical protein